MGDFKKQHNVFYITKKIIETTTKNLQNLVIITKTNFRPIKTGLKSFLTR